jgi:hypothetical protein
MANSEWPVDWTNGYELNVSERLVLVPVGGPSLPKGGRSVRGTPVHLVSSRRGVVVEGEMMVCKVLTDLFRVEKDVARIGSEDARAE